MVVGSGKQRQVKLGPLFKRSADKKGLEKATAHSMSRSAEKLDERIENQKSQQVKRSRKRNGQHQVRLIG